MILVRKKIIVIDRSLLVNRFVSSNNVTQFNNFSVEWINFNLFTCSSPEVINASVFNCVSRNYHRVDDISCLEQTSIDFQLSTCQTFVTTQVGRINLEWIGLLLNNGFSDFKENSLELSGKKKCCF